MKPPMCYALTRRRIALCIFQICQRFISGICKVFDGGNRLIKYAASCFIKGIYDLFRSTKLLGKSGPDVQDHHDSIAGSPCAFFGS